MPSSAHIVEIDRHGRIASATLAETSRFPLEAAFLRTPWWRSRWQSRSFREASRKLACAAGGLAIVGPGMHFKVPPPFVEQFEPIEIGVGFLGQRRLLETPSGTTPTRQEWLTRIVVRPLVIVGVIAFLVGLFYFRFHPPRSAVLMVTVMAGSTLLSLGVNFVAKHVRGRWFLLPGAIAVVRRPARRGAAARITILSHGDTCLVLRYMPRGKTRVLMAELWMHLGKLARKHVSQREAISILAAWQSPLDPPPEERLYDIATA